MGFLYWLAGICAVIIVAWVVFSIVVERARKTQIMGGSVTEGMP